MQDLPSLILPHHTDSLSIVSINKLSNETYVSLEIIKETPLISLKSAVSCMQEDKHF